MSIDVFISYRHSDAEIARWLKSCLHVGGMRPWMDTEITPSNPWDEDIAKKIQQSRLVIVVVSRNAEEDPHQIKREIALADHYRVPIVPVRVDSARLERCAFFLATSQWLDISTPPKEQHSVKVIEAVQKILGKIQGEPSPESSARIPIPPSISAAVGPVADGGGNKPPRVSILYKRSAQPDETLLHHIENSLSQRGYQIFHDRHLHMGVEWFQEIERKMRESHAIIPLLSSQSVESEMLSMELRTAQEARQAQNGKPMILPVRVRFGGSLPAELASSLDRLQYFLWESPEQNEKLIDELVRAMENATEAKKQFDASSMALPTGAVPLDSPFYVTRECDQAMERAISGRESVVLVKGARQMGKTSLIARGLNQARKAGCKVVSSDLQKLNLAHLETIDGFYRALAGMMANQLKLAKRPSQVWDDQDGPNANLEHYVADIALESTEGRPLVWALDEVDRVFDRPFSSEFFGLLRTWHNDRANDPEGPWSNLTILIGYATEAKLFIQELNMSPFNVGLPLNLRDFNPDEVAELNHRYNSPVTDDAGIQELHALLGGQPYLTRRCLHEMAVAGVPFEKLKLTIDSNEGIFGDHLRRFYVLLQKNPAMMEAMRQFLRGKNVLTEEVFYGLRSGGLLQGESRDTVALRCGIYESYLRRHLL